MNINEDHDPSSPLLLNRELVKSVDENKATEKRDKKHLMPFWHKIIFGLQYFFLGSELILMNVFIYQYYTGNVGFDIGSLSVSLLVMSVIQTIVTPVQGWILDITKSRWGRRKPWIILSSFILFSTVVLTYYPPLEYPSFLDGFGFQKCTAVWITTVNLLNSVAQSIFATTLTSFGIEATQNFEERSSMFGYAQGFQIVSSVGATFLYNYAENYFTGGSLRTLMLYVNSVSAFLAIGLSILMCVVMKEKTTPQAYAKRVPLAASVRTAMCNRPFLVVLAMLMLWSISPDEFMGYWIQYRLQANHFWTGVLMSVFHAAGLVFTPVANLVAKRIGKKYTIALGFFVSSLGYIMFPFIQKEQYWFALVAFALAGGATNGVSFLTSSILGDSIDYDELRHGTRREATFGSLCNYFENISGSISGVLSLAMLSSAGFVPNAVQTEKVQITLNIIMASSAVFHVGSILTLFLFPITKTKYYAILEATKLSKKGELTTDPLTGKTVFPHKDEEFERYWALQTFSIRDYVSVGLDKEKLHRRVLVYITIWIVLTIGNLVLWILYPNEASITASLFSLFFCMIFYEILRLIVYFKMKNDPTITKNDVQDHHKSVT